LLVVVVVHIMVVEEVLVDFYCMDRQHQQKLQMVQQSHMQIVPLTQYLLVLVVLLLGHILSLQKEETVELLLY